MNDEEPGLVIQHPSKMRAVTLMDDTIRVPSTARVTVRRVTMHDEQEFVHLAEESVGLHRPWIYAPATREAFREYVNRFSQPSSSTVGWVVCEKDTNSIAGFINLNEVVRGPYQRGLLGYGVFEPYARRGYMTEGLAAVITCAFLPAEPPDHGLGLHRLEADIQPDNVRSSRLVQRLGFQREGLSPGFIRIDGKWMDHERWALTSDMVRP